MSTILAQARLRACRHWPFASHAILSMVPVPRPGLGTLAVDSHWRLYFDEAALQQMGTEQAAGLILHELDHLLKRHHKRGEQMVADNVARWDTWNHATDASINAGLRSEGIPLPDGLIYPEQFGLPAGLSAEEYFRELTKPNDNEPQNDQEDDDDEPSDDGETPEDGAESAGADGDAGSGTDPEGTDDQDAEGTAGPTGGSPDPVEPMGGEDEPDARPVDGAGDDSDGDHQHDE